MRVLVVEVDPLQAGVLFHAFRKPGYTVTHENNGKRVDHLLLANEFDVANSALRPVEFTPKAVTRFIAYLFRQTLV